MKAKKKLVKKSKKPKPKKVSSPKKAKAKIQKPIGVVLHYFRKIKVAVVKFKQTVKKGTEVRFEGATTSFREKLESMQFDHKPLMLAPKNKKVGIKVAKRVREGDKIFKD